jgi:ribosomal protein S18 acetylase RimI-like enzyme
MLPAMTSGAPRRIVTASTVDLRIRDGDARDAVEIESVHFASREAAYADRVSQWPPPGPDREGRAERWRAWLEDPAISCLVGHAGGEIVGFCTVRPSADPDAGPFVADMPTLYVRPDLWRVGVGRRLCEAGMARASERGFRTLTLWVLEMNERARSFYHALGFVWDGAEKIDEATSDRLPARRYSIELEGVAAGS